MAHSSDGGIHLSRFWAGDTALFRELFQTVSPHLRRFVRGFARDDDHADDLLQECWIRIWLRRKKFSGNGSFVGWAVAVSRNVCNTASRRKRPKRMVRLDDVKEIRDQAPDPADDLEEHRRREVLNSAIGRIGQRERTAIIGMYMEQRTTREIARTMGVTDTAVRSLIHRACRKLGKMDEVMELMVDTD